jgi:hypothetical protein
LNRGTRLTNNVWAFPAEANMLDSHTGKVRHHQVRRFV